MGYHPMTAARWIIRAALVVLFWSCVALWFCVSSGCAHDPGCLCGPCEVQYYAEREADRQEGAQR